MQFILRVQTTRCECTSQVDTGTHQVEQNGYSGEFAVTARTCILYHSYNFPAILKLFPNQKLNTQMVCMVYDTIPTQQPAGSVQPH